MACQILTENSLFQTDKKHILSSKGHGEIYHNINSCHCNYISKTKQKCLHIFGHAVNVKKTIKHYDIWFMWNGPQTNNASTISFVCVWICNPFKTLAAPRTQSSVNYSYHEIPNQFISNHTYRCNWGGCSIASILDRNSSSTQISRNLIRPIHPFYWPNRFENLHRARQYHCRAPCKISKRLANLKNNLCSKILVRFQYKMSFIEMLQQPPVVYHWNSPETPS